jgi:hypothetical protein
LLQLHNEQQYLFPFRVRIHICRQFVFENWVKESFGFVDNCNTSLFLAYNLIKPNFFMQFLRVHETSPLSRDDAFNDLKSLS